MTKAERLAHPCPECNAKPGEPCRDRLGDELKRGHVTRGPGALEAHKAKEAERINARAVASYGPLFADLAAAEVKPVTAADLIDRDRRAAALAFDATGGPSGMALLRQCNRGLEWLWVQHVARELARLGGEAGAALAADAIRKYPADVHRAARAAAPDRRGHRRRRGRRGRGRPAVLRHGMNWAESQRDSPRRPFTRPGFMLVYFASAPPTRPTR